MRHYKRYTLQFSAFHVFDAYYYWCILGTPPMDTRPHVIRLALYNRRALDALKRAWQCRRDPNIARVLKRHHLDVTFYNMAVLPLHYYYLVHPESLEGVEHE